MPATYRVDATARHRTGSNRRWPRTRIRQSERPQPRLVNPRTENGKKGKRPHADLPGCALGYLDKPQTLFHLLI